MTTLTSSRDGVATRGDGRRGITSRASGRTHRRSWLDAVLVGFDLLVLVVATIGVPFASRLAFAMLTLAAITAIGGYRHKLTIQVSSEMPRMLVAVAASAGLVGAAQPDTEATRLLLVSVIPAGLGLLGARIATWIILRQRRRRGLQMQPTIVVGAGIVGQRVAGHLSEHPEYGLAPVGFVDDAMDTPPKLPIVGRVSELSDVVDRFGATQVIVAFGITGEESLIGAVRDCQHLDVEFWVVPRFFEMGMSGAGSDTNVWGLPLVHLRRPALRTAQWRLKRVFDAVVTAVGLALLTPVLLLIAAAVKLTTPGPVFFRQRRIGQRGVPFDVLKFRTMEVNDDQSTTWNVTSDPRVTTVGRFLRPTSLDELPQLFNVMRGDMSLVGPRPERPHFVEKFEVLYPGYGDRHRVPVGITGLAQVNGLRGDTSIAERAVFDNYYIENWSLWNDVVILLRTVFAVIRPPRSVRIESGADALDPAET